MQFNLTGHPSDSALTCMLVEITAENIKEGHSIFHRVYDIQYTEKFNLDVCEQIVQKNLSEYGKPHSFGLNGNYAFIFFHDSGYENIIAFTQYGSLIRASVYGDREFLSQVDKFELIETADVNLTWTYTNSRGDCTSKVFPIESSPQVHDEYYPFLSDGVETFIDRFLESKAPILLLLGAPGTGKTTFIKHMIFTRKLNTMVTFDEKVMQSDSYYIDYLAGHGQNRLMVIEDADIILESRENGKNGLMTKLLNVSDGLVPLLRKKIIFSTNLENLAKIDAALMRPGRCFDTVLFRQLSNDEAFRAAEKAGVEFVPNRQKEHTLSEIFNGKNNTQSVKKIGF